MAIIKRQIGCIEINDRPGQGRPNIRTRIQKQIKPQMQRPALARSHAGNKSFGRVNWSILTPRADAQGGSFPGSNFQPCFFCCVRPPLSRGPRDGMLYVPKRHKCLCHHRTGLIQNGGHVLPIGLNPGNNRLCAGRCLKSAGLAQKTRDENRLHGPQSVQKRPCRCLADREIGVVFNALPSRRRECHADHESKRDKVK